MGWLGLVSQLIGWVGSGHTKWTHGQLCEGRAVGVAIVVDMAAQITSQSWISVSAPARCRLRLRICRGVKSALPPVESLFVYAGWVKKVRFCTVIDISKARQ